MENGGGFIGYHVSAFCTNANEWSWYHTTFLGCGAFNTNTWGPTSAKMKVEDTTHPVTKGFPQVYTSEVSEWYNWTVDIRQNKDIKILCSIDPSSYPLGTDPNQSWYSGYNPIVWTNTKYKMIYNNSGHNDMDYAANVGKSKTWGNDQHVKLIMNALFWLAGESTTGIGGVATSSPVPGNPDFDIHFDQARLTVAKTGVPFFDVSVLDARGKMLRSGRSENGVFSTDRVELGKGLYIVRAQSPAGNMARTLSLP
jgi:hypothetical protein